MSRTQIRQTTVSSVLPTPFELSAMDATAVSTTLAAASNGSVAALILTSLTGISTGDYLLVGGAERALVTSLPDGSYITSSVKNAGGPGYVVGETGTLNGGKRAPL